MSPLSTKHLTKSFGGVHAIDQVNLSFETGNITALIGPNGSGKTTFIHTVTGLHAMDGGKLVVNDTIHLSRITPRDAAAHGITRTFQSVRLFQQMTVLDNLLVVLTERNVWKAFFDTAGARHLDTAENILKKVGLWEKRHHAAEHLSYGQRKLLEIARALAMRAQIYFFDEPFAGLFPEMRKIVSGILRELRTEGKAVVLVEHDMELIRTLADHCYVLDAGKVIAHGTPEEVLREPHVIEAYLGK